MKRFVVTSIETKPNGSILIRGPSGSIRIKRHECGDHGYEHSFSHALMAKDDTNQSRQEDCHQVSIEELDFDKGMVF